MGKKGTKGRGVVAIALFEIAGAMERWAAAEERRNELLHDANDLHAEATASQVNVNDAFRQSFAALGADVASDEKSDGVERAHYNQSHRRFHFLDGVGKPYSSLIVARKKSRILAFVAEVPFIVETDRGPMTGEPGDYIVTNHPDDDPGSDLWTISRERFESTYEVLSDGDA